MKRSCISGSALAHGLPDYNNFPRIVGETGGKDFIVAHPSADVEVLAANVIRGAFEYQGQKCSAASRLYVPDTLWNPLKARLLQELPKLKVGPVEDLSVCMGALISEEAFKKVVSYIDYAKQHPESYEIIYGGECDSARGWFVITDGHRGQGPAREAHDRRDLWPGAHRLRLPGRRLRGNPEAVRHLHALWAHRRHLRPGSPGDRPG